MWLLLDRDAILSVDAKMPPPARRADREAGAIATFLLVFAVSLVGLWVDLTAIQRLVV